METIYEFDSTVITHRKICISRIENTDFAFYEDKRTLFIPLSSNICKNGIESHEIYKGITSIENIKKVRDLNPIDLHVHAPKMYKKTAVVAVIKKDILKKVRSGMIHICDAIEYPNDVDYSDDVYIPVLWNYATYKITDLRYNFISIPIHFSYIDGCVDNGHYDLDQLLQKLKADKNVCDPINLKISDIPYYNCDGDTTQFIDFKYLLPDEIYNDIIHMDNFSLRKHILNDIIGAKEFEKK